MSCQVHAHLGMFKMTMPCREGKGIRCPSHSSCTRCSRFLYVFCNNYIACKNTIETENTHTHTTVYPISLNTHFKIIHSIITVSSRNILASYFPATNTVCLFFPPLLQATSIPHFMTFKLSGQIFPTEFCLHFFGTEDQIFDLQRIHKNHNFINIY